MLSSHGKFVWYELMTTDINAAENFYRDVLGWEVRDSGMPGIIYRLLRTAEADIGGMMVIPETVTQAGGRPSWIGYVAVDDVDASAGFASRLGGTIHHAPEDIPGVGRFAVIADPQGAVTCLFKGAGALRTELPGGTPGDVGWRELSTTDREAGFAFYAELFGWAKGDAIDMGPLGIYQLFTIAGIPCGGMMTKAAEQPRSVWAYYFNVAEIDAAITCVVDSGGRVLDGPMQVPGGSWIAHALDPLGTAFAMVGPRA